MGKSTLTITDNRTGQSREIAITDGAIRAMDLRQLKSGPDDFGLLTYDPALMTRRRRAARLPSSRATRASSGRPDAARARPMLTA
jgi:hypothetical protein